MPTTTSTANRENRHREDRIVLRLATLENLETQSTPKRHQIRNGALSLRNKHFPTSHSRPSPGRLRSDIDLDEKKIPSNLSHTEKAAAGRHGYHEMRWLAGRSLSQKRDNRHGILSTRPFKKSKSNMNRRHPRMCSSMRLRQY